MADTDLDSPQDATDTAAAADAPSEREDSMLTVEGVEKTFGSGADAVRAVDDVSFAVERGTVVGLLGPNGAGKTTTIKSILGLVIPDSGRIEVDGVDVLDDPIAAYRRIGAMLEGARNVYWRLTVRENLEFFAALGGQDPAEARDRHDELLDQLALAEKADTPVKELSRGMKQKVSLASTLARDADVVFLDEPTLGLDVESSLELRRELRRLVEEESMTVLLSSHDMDVVEEVCDRAIVMQDGRVVADDAVDELIDLFRTQAYRITVESLPEGFGDLLADEYGVDGVERVGDRRQFEAAVEGSGEFYALIDDLRAAGVDVAAVSTLEPDFEEVFLRLTDEGGVSA